MFDIIRMPDVLSNIFITAKLGIVNSQFYTIFRLCSSKFFFISQMISLIALLKSKGYPLKIVLKRSRGLLDIEEFLVGISVFGVF